VATKAGERRLELGRFTVGCTILAGALLCGCSHPTPKAQEEPAPASSSAPAAAAAGAAATPAQTPAAPATSASVPPLDAAGAPPQTARAARQRPEAGTAAGSRTTANAIPGSPAAPPAASVRAPRGGAGAAPQGLVPMPDFPDPDFSADAGGGKRAAPSGGSRLGTDLELPPDPSGGSANAPSASPAGGSSVNDRSGVIVWTGNLPRGGQLVIDGSRASTGRLSGALPGKPVEIEMDSSEFAIAEAPNPANGWRRLAFRSRNKPQTSVTVRWTLVR
jgi:hypothetical protein